MWLLPRWRWVSIGVGGTVLVSWAMVVTYIVLRGMIRGKYPLTNLYEVTLMIAAMGVPLLLFVERFDRQRIWLAASTVYATALLFIARLYERRCG